MVSNYYLLGRSTSGAGAGIDPAKEAFSNANLPALGSTVQPRQEIGSTPSGEIGIGGRLHRLTKSTTPSFEVAAVQMLLQHYTKIDSPVTGLMAQKDIANAVRFPQQYPHAQLSLEKGAEGGLVRDVQARLKMIGFLDANPTGKIAEKTQSAIARFQSSIAELAAQPLGVLTIDTLAHILRKSEWTPGVRATTPVSPEFKSQGANPSNAKGFDHKLLAEMEGHFRTKGYTLPPKEYPSAGITISNGVDLGQWSRESLLKIGVSEALVNKLDNQNVSYLLLRGKEAEAYLIKHPLSISPAESKVLYEKVFAQIVSQFADTYDRRRAPDAPRFADLPAELKTAFGSMAFNMGPSFTEVTGDGPFSRWRRAVGAEIFAGNYEKVFQLLVVNPHPKEGLQNRRWKEAAIVLEHISTRNPDAASKLLGSVTSACAKANKASLVQNFKRIANEFRPGLIASIPPSHSSTEADVATTKPKSKTPEPSPEQKRPEVHIVRKGDTLYALAKRFDCSVEELQKANNLKGTALSIGQKLRIPNAELADNAPRRGNHKLRPVS